MLDHDRKVIYVGKARNLKKRVSSYFQRQPESSRTRTMLAKLHDITITISASEAEALMLEHNLIKQLKPRYNVLLKDSKSYPYILLTREPYPKFRLYRGRRSEAGEYFGPFSSSSAVRSSLHAMQKIFRIRDCEDSVFKNRSRPCMQFQIGRCSAPCCNRISDRKYAAQVQEALAFLRGKDNKLLQKWENRMQSFSEELEFEQAALLRDRIQNLRIILDDGHKKGLPKDADAITIIRQAGRVLAGVGVRRCGRDMGGDTLEVQQASKASDMDILHRLFCARYSREAPPKEILLEAGIKQVNKLQHLLKLLHSEARSTVRIAKRGARMHWLQQIRHSGKSSLISLNKGHQKAAFESLAALLKLNDLPGQIAAVDNAHLGGQQTTAAIVYGNHSGPEKKFYRHYKLDDVPAGDDYAAMHRVLSRFFSAIHRETIPEPDLLLIDGGRGQLRIAMRVAADYGFSRLRLLAVAKGEKRRVGDETLWPGWSDDDSGIGNPLRPGIHSPALMLIARLRDEAHRFAGRYLRQRRKKGMFESSLNAISGVGTTRRTALLKHFGGIKGVKRASRQQLMAVPGISETLAERIFIALHA